MRVLLIGLPKTGTSAIYKSVVASFPSMPACYFEPTTFGIEKISMGVSFHEEITKSPNTNVVTKCLLFPRFHGGQPEKLADVTGFYDKVVLIQRDPRDRVISENLYLWYHKHGYWNRTQLEEFIDQLNKKEHRPDAIPFFQLCRPLPGESGKGFLKGRETFTYRNLIQLTRKGDFFVLRYEDFIDRRFSELEEYLDLPMVTPSQSDSDDVEKRVARTKKYGNWRDWFTEEDVPFFRPIYAEYLSTCYPDHDWALNSPLNLDPSEGSEYVRRIASDASA